MEAIGERLKRKREESGLTLEQAAEATKFPPEIIAAVEEGRIGIFSAKAYHVAFIRAYARLLNLDADQLIRDQKTEEERAQEALRGIKTIAPKSRMPRTALIMAAAVVVLAVVILVIINLVFREKPERAESELRGSSGAGEAGAAGLSSKPGPGMSRISIPPDQPGRKPGSGGGEPATAGGPAGGAEAGAAGAVIDSASVDTTSTDSTQAAGPAIVPGTSWPIIPAGPGRGEGRPRTLELSASGGAIITLTAGDSTLFEGQLTGGDRKVFTSRKPFRLVFLNDRNAVTLILDGKPVVLPESGKRQVFDYLLP